MRNKDSMKLYYTTFESPLGWLLLVGKDGKLVELHRPKPSREEAISDVPPEAEESESGFGEIIELLRLYFQGKPVDFSRVPVELDGLGEFEKSVLIEAMKIPYGSITSYGELAAIAGSPGAARAVGNAMRKNPLLIIVPCHRVLYSSGGIGGYSAGLNLKRKLLALEGVSI